MGDAGKQQRGQRRGLSLESFVNAKQHQASYARERERRDFVRRAEIVRKYKRILKREGYEVDEPASKKRGREEGAQDQPRGKFDKRGGPKRRREPKSDPYQKAKALAKKREEEAKAKAEDIARQEREKKQRMRERKRQHRKLTEKTKRGQPVMKHKIDHLLAKIEKGV